MSTTGQKQGPYLPVFIGPPESIGDSNSKMPPKPEGMTVRELLVIHHTARFIRIHGEQAEIVCRLNPAMEAYVPFLSPEHPYNTYYSYTYRCLKSFISYYTSDSTPAYQCLLPPGWKERDQQLQEYLNASSESSQTSVEKPSRPISIDLTQLSATSPPQQHTDVLSSSHRASDGDDDSLVS